MASFTALMRISPSNTSEREREIKEKHESKLSRVCDAVPKHFVRKSLLNLNSKFASIARKLKHYYNISILSIYARALNLTKEKNRERERRANADRGNNQQQKSIACASTRG
jgi:Zn-dependent peptidase ImmA (M78 family)